MFKARRDLREPLLNFDALVVKENPGKTLLDSRNPFQKKNEWISKWKINPHINPHINRYLNPKKKYIIIASLDPKSEYVRLYKEALKSLIKEKKISFLYPLSFADCEFIRKSLPDIHVYKYKEDGEEYSYDHLFAKYFLKKKKYTPKYSADEIDIFLYLELYNILKRKTITGLQGFGERDPLIVTDSNAKMNPFYKRFFSRTEKAYLLKESESSSSQFEFNHNTFDFLRDNIDHSLFMKGGISIYNIMEKLCKDIKEILYKDITSLNKENILKLKTNLKVLKFVYHIYKVANFDKERLKFTDDLYSVVKDEKEKFSSKKLRLKKNDPIYGMLFIYIIIINAIYKLEKYWKNYEDEEKLNIEISESNFEINRFFNILIEIYNNIILLYEYEPNKSSNKLKDMLILSMKSKYINKLEAVESVVDNCVELEIIGNYSIYLAINLGNKDLPILFSYTNKNDPGRDIIDNEESLVFNIPIFNCKDKNDIILFLIQEYINGGGGVFILYDKLINLKNDIETLEEPKNPINIYNRYLEIFKVSQGGRKKRIIKSKKNIIKQKKGNKIIT
jgi:hypothetical protein